MLKTVELRHLRYFIALAEELNFRQAAEQLHISQPPLSRQIRELEAEIGAKLFHRSNRNVQLTPAGKIFLQKAYQILDSVEQAGIITRMSSAGKSGELRIGFSGSVQDLVPVLRMFRREYPDAGFFLHHMNSSEQIAALHEKRIDLAFIYIPVKNDLLATKPVRQLRLAAALPANHPLARKTPLYLSDLKDESFIITEKTMSVQYYQTVMNLFLREGFAPNVIMQAGDLQTVLMFVEAGMGITLEPVFEEFGNENGGIVRRMLEDVPLSFTSSMVWRKDNRSPFLRPFIEMTEQHFAPKESAG